jgi:citrate lyase subunit beta/citryl-CoA lyase
MISTDDVKVRRTTLVVPANRRRFIEKSITTEADVVMLDMEDAVVYTDEAKAEARRTVLYAMRNIDFSHKEVIIRANPVNSPWFDADLETIVQARPQAIVPAKVTTADDVMKVEAKLEAAGAPDDLGIWVGVETVGAVLNCESIARASRRVELLRFGIGDYTVTMQGQFAEDNSHLIYPLSKVLAVARWLGLMATAAAVVFSDIRRVDLVRQNAVLLRRLGYDGATVIHPSHLAEVNAVFTPTADEIEWALRQEEMLAKAKDDAVVVVDGQLVEMVHLKLARRTLAIARKLGLTT